VGSRAIRQLRSGVNWVDSVPLKDVQDTLKADAEDILFRLKFHMRDISDKDVVIYFAKINNKKNEIVNDFAEYRNGELTIKR
jgi:hypothetical protein